MKINLVSAGWCTVCPQAKTLLDNAGVEYTVVDADTSEGQDYCIEYGVRSLPTLVVEHTTIGIYAGLQPIKNFLGGRE